MFVFIHFFLLCSFLAIVFLSVCSFSVFCEVSLIVQILCVTFPLTYENEKNYLHMFSDRFFSVSAALSCLAPSTRIWPVWSVIFAWLMSQKVGLLITAQQFFVNDSSVWECEWETFKGIFYVKVKANNINSTWGMKQRQSERGKRGKSLWNISLNVFFVATLELTSSNVSDKI